MSITNSGSAAITSKFGTTFWLELGTGATAFDYAQTALVAAITDSGLERAAATVTRVTTTDANDTLQCTKTWTATGTKAIAEAGVFDAASGPTMWARKVLGAAQTVNSTETFALTYKIVVVN
jgi:hypothetical protein